MLNKLNKVEYKMLKKDCRNIWRMYNGEVACSVWGRVWDKKCPNDCPDYWKHRK